MRLYDDVDQRQIFEMLKLDAGRRSIRSTSLHPMVSNVVDLSPHPAIDTFKTTPFDNRFEVSLVYSYNVMTGMLGHVA